MIQWRSGLSGFVGGSKRLIKGFVDFSYTLTSADAVITPDPIPSGNKRTTSFSGLNRSSAHKGKNRTMSKTNRNRTMKIKL